MALMGLLPLPVCRQLLLSSVKLGRSDEGLLGRIDGSIDYRTTATPPFSFSSSLRFNGYTVFELNMDE